MRHDGMLSTLGRLEPSRTPAPAGDPAAPPSPRVLRELHADFVRQKRRAFFLASPLLLLSAAGWIAAIARPQEFGGLAFFAFITVSIVGRTGYEWLTLRRADPIALYEREQRDADQIRQWTIDHLLLSATVRRHVTFVLAGVIVAVTLVQFLWVPLGAGLASAALVKPAVRAGEWWRLLTASYLHGSVMHITSNAGVLVLLGGLIETYDRRARIPLVYLAAAIGGNILSTLTFDQTAIGASGGVLGLAGYLLAVSSGPSTRAPVWIRRQVLSILGSTALMGLAAFMFIDNAAHAGGVLTGAGIGLIARHGSPRAEAALDTAGWVAGAILLAGAAYTVSRLLT